jgi:hypothetical protein
METTDAVVWAAEFMKIAPEVDEGAMIGWFANAIENGRDAGRKEALAEVAGRLPCHGASASCSSRRLCDGCFYRNKALGLVAPDEQ